MQGLLSILSLFCNKFEKFGNTGAGMLDSIIFLKSHFWCENSRICHIYNVHDIKFLP